MPFTYILRCADDTLYIGHTENLAVREQMHNDGKGAKYTAARRPVRMIYAEEHDSIEGAIAREQQLKRWTNQKKEALIAGDGRALKSLSRKSTNSTGAFTWRDLLNRVP